MITHRTYSKPANWMTRKWVAGALALLLVAVCSLDQPGKAASRPAGLEKLEYTLQALNPSKINPGQTFDVVIRFGESSSKTWGCLQDNKTVEKWVKTISKSGGTPLKEWSHFPAILARVNYTTLMDLAANTLVNRISVDWPVKKNLSTTAVAILSLIHISEPTRPY